MTTLCLFEDAEVLHLRPLVDMRAAYQLRPGIYTLLESVRALVPPSPVILHARPDVASIAAAGLNLPVNTGVTGAVVFVNGRLLAEEGMVMERIHALFAPDAPELALVQNNDLIAARIHAATPALWQHPFLGIDAFSTIPRESVTGARLIRRLWDLIEEIRRALRYDAGPWASASDWRRVDPTSAGVHVLVPEQVFVAPEVTLRPGAILNASAGPIVIDRDSTVMEGAILRGPLYIGPRSTVKPRADLEGCSIGPGCKIGGEVQDTIFHAHANKGHEGFLGHSFVGKWCNLGAGTTVSNLRNDYGEVTLFNEHLNTFEPTDRQFLGVIMADHTKTGIQTMINTGSVFGVSCNLFGAGYQERYVPAFSWGGPGKGLQSYRIEKALDVAERIMARRQLPMTIDERERLIALFRRAHPYHR